MKNKPQKHKETNVFKFQSFAERITQIDIRHTALYHIQHGNEEVVLEENETYFHQAYIKWIALNLTEEYNLFQRKIRNIVTLPQLIHQKEFVVDLLLKSLKQATTLSLQPLLEFVVILAKDLREDFYPYFQRFLDQLIELLDSKDADQIEWTFICLAFLFKTLKPFLKKDITIVFNAILPLLSRRTTEYIQNFAAECFSFVARDIKDKSKFLQLILTGLKQHANGTSGCGRLLFECIKGINGNVHSCTEQFLEIIFSAFTNQDYNQSILFDVIEYCVKSMLHNIESKNMTIFWNVCYRVMETKMLPNANQNDQAILNMLSIITQIIEFRQGRYLSNVEQMIALLIKIVDTDISNDTLMLTSQLIAMMLKSSNLNITQLDASRLTQKILSQPSREVFEAFVWNTVNYAQFNILILPEFLKYFEQYYTVNDRKPLQLLSKIILNKSPLIINGINLSSWKQYQIRLKSEQILNQLENIILNEVDDKINEEFLEVLIVYPHILGVDTAKIVNTLQLLMSHLCSILNLDTISVEKNQMIIFKLAVIVETLIHLKQISCVDCLAIIKVLLPYGQLIQYSPVLNVIDLLLNADKNLLTIELFDEIHGKLAENLSSYCHTMRLLTTHIFCQFQQIEILPGLEIFKIFFDIESIDANVQTYREQIILLQKLAADMELSESIRDMSYGKDPLRYLLGLLYMNFNLIWKPVSKLIVTYCEQLQTDEFWNIFKQKLDQSNTHITDGNTTVSNKIIADKNTFINEQITQYWTILNRIDFINYRILLWRILPDLGCQLIDIKNRDIVTFVMEFIDNEYRRSNENDSRTWNILEKSNENYAENNHDNEDDNQVSENNLKINLQHKGTQRTLIAMVNVFIKLRNPKQMYRQTDLYNLYMELLCHRNPHIQKLAFDCIMVYKHKYLVPYKEHFFNIIDEAKFKEALQGFKINAEAGIVQPEHRADLMPILMRILYSKLIARGQKGTGNMRKSLIMRFLAGCQQDEILILFKMSFNVYEKYLKNHTDILKMCNHIKETINFEAIISPKKLQSSLNLIEIIREQFGGLMGNTFLQHLLKVLFCIGSIISAVLDNEDSSEINSVHLKLYKTMRTSCIQSLSNFFTHFDVYPWQTNEIEAIFIIFINPLLQKLPNDSIHSATPLLKLLTVFGKNSRYFVMLTKRITDDPSNDTSPMHYIMTLLLQPNTKPLVCLCIMELIQNLLSFSDEQLNEQGEIVPSIEPLNCIVKSSLSVCEQQINYGSQILLPYLPKILEKFQLNLRKRRGLTKRDLHILFRCTELIEDSTTCCSLLNVLLPILVRKSHSNAAEEVLSQMVTTIANLFQRIDEPQCYLRDIAPMFEQITAVGPRKLLCDLIGTIAKRLSFSTENIDQYERILTIAKLVTELNSWDRRWVEQPNYERRLMAYKTIGELQANGKIDLNLGLIIIYHSFYFIKHDKDMAMRDSAAHHLKNLLPALAKQFSSNNNNVDLDYLIGNVILNLCRRSLVDKNENIRTESLLLLGELARKCSTIHPVLQDLHQLTNAQDREVDFFDNITHLQTHRHGKALLKFCSIAKTLDRTPSPRTLTQFILPLATQYLCTDKYATKHGLVTSAIETVGAVCRLLPWHQYESILKFYLKKMRYNVEHQKQLVRLVMQILDSFHFDLSRAQIGAQVIAKISENNETIDNEVNIPSSTNEKVAPDPDEEEIVLQTSDDILNDDTNNLVDELNETVVNDIINDEEDNENVLNGSELHSPVKRIKICVYDQPIILGQKAAARLIQTIATGLIPMLNNSITTISAYESFHKLNKKKRRSEREEEEILRVPIALAMVKLLQKLPEKMLKHSLPGIFMKVCMFLKSPLRSVRMVARDVLKKIMLTVSTAYLECLLHQLTALLTRGFQVHVLTVTVYSVLDAIKTKLKIGEIDNVLQSVLAVCIEDIFGKSAEEKIIHKIGNATPEAKPSNKSYLALHILANNITESCLLDLMIPFKDLLAKYQSKSVVIKIQECFQKIIMGLALNKHIAIESMIMFIYGTISESIPELLPGTENIQLTKAQKELIQRARPDCYLIQPEPRGRSGAIRKIVKTNVKANAHVLVEFGLDILHILLKRGKILKINYEPFIDPIIPILLDSLKSTHIHVTIYALKCLASLWTREMITDNLQKIVPNIVPEIFTILHKYAATNSSMSADNLSLVKNAFKSMVSLLRFANYYQITEEQLKTLLLYIEQNLHDTSKQPIAFTLLKVIIERKLLVNEMHDVMHKISELAILSDSSSVRFDAKAIMVNYLMNYPLGKKIDAFLQFFIANLNYELCSGRESAIQILQAIIKRFPQDVLIAKGGLLFLSLGARLVNDESSDCRKMIADCIESLLNKLDESNRNQLFDIVTVLLTDRKLSHKEMAAMLCTRFIAVEKNTFENRLEKLMPILVGTLCGDKDHKPGQFVRIQTNRNLLDEIMNEENNDDSETVELKLNQRQRARDHQLIQCMNTLLKILELYWPALIDKSSQYIDELSYEIQKLLAYEHVWVRLSSAKIIDVLLSHIDVNILRTNLLSDDSNAYENAMTIDYLYNNSKSELKSLCLDLCAQMIPDETESDLADLVVKNLLYIANIVKDVPSIKRHNIVEQQENETTENKAINLAWLIRRMRYIVHAEVAKTPHSIVLRTAIFHWIEGVTELLSADTLMAHVSTLLAPIVREMCDDDRNIDAKLRQLAIKVGNTIRKKIGDDEYQQLRTKLQTKLMMKRAERKKIIAQVKINDPVRASMRRQGEQKRKQMAKKRKIDEVKGRVAPKKKKIKRKNEDDIF